jgi:Holliday junction DNA helicase RuvA
MIGKLRGIILEKHPPQLLLEVNGVGYEIDASMNTFYQLPEVGQEVSLFTHFVVREDAQHLYGFSAQSERGLFRTLLKVNGVGPRVALTILSSMSTDDFIRCIANNDSASLTRVPGIGKKTAERLLIEMRDKVSGLEAGMPLSHPPQSSVPASRRQITQDALSALIALGYKPPEASRMVSKVDDGNLTSEEIIRQALREKVV